MTGLENLNPEKLGIDEIAYEKGHRYLTIVRDLDIGRVIWVGETRKKEALDAFFAELGAEKCADIQVCVIDMWDPHIASIHENTNAEIVYDFFHVAQKITDAVDTVHRQEFEKTDAATRKKEVQEETVPDPEAQEEVG